MKRESVGICVCAISQADKNEFLNSNLHTPLYIKSILLLASCNHHLATWLSVAIMIFFFNIEYVTAQIK